MILARPPETRIQWSCPLYELTAETAQDYHEAEALFDLCFAPGRTALSSYRLRDGIPSARGLSLVARDVDGVLAGAIRYWPVHVGTHDALLLGPVAVHPTRQGEGLAAVLINESLGLAVLRGWKRVLLVGDAPYYSKLGFVMLEGVIMPQPTNPDRVLGQALVPGGWDGVEGQVTRWTRDTD